MLEYHPKCRDFQRSLERERWTVRTDELSRDGVVDMVEELDAGYDEERAQIFAAVADLRGRLRQSAERSRQALPLDLR
jgi:hypothetical protein